MSDALPVIVGITGASGVSIAKQTIDMLLESSTPTIVSASSAARIVWQEEMDESFGSALERWRDSDLFQYYPPQQITAPVASGSFPTRGMAIVPCSMATLAAIAHGMSDNLIRRCADVSIKERRPLTLMTRETPLSAIHLENMAKLANLGVKIMPPDPPFYLKLEYVEQIAEYFAHRVVSALGVTDTLPEHLQYRGPGNL
jgi:4-hydroxy-3-polyprenylbenzoate decarboxylase